MKRIRRPGVSPPTLKQGGTAWNDADAREQRFKKDEDVKQVNSKWAEYWGNADVRGALWAMHGRACVYCDRNLPGTDRGDVEHFRPKSTYWWLAYRFDNYFLACSACNTAYKGNKFPILPPHIAFAYASRDQIAQEQRALIDPSVDTLDAWFGMNFDLEEAKRKGVQLTISPGLAPLDAERCRLTCDFFMLNLDAELLQERLVAVHAALDLASKALDGDANSRDELQRRAIRYCPHSLAVRLVIVVQAQRPEYLPSKEQEVAWLIDELSQMLRLALNAVEARPDGHKAKDLRDRCAWALAVLLKDPPALSTDEMRKQLKANDVLHIVEPFYAEII